MLQRLLDHQAGPWQPNQYNDSGGASPGGGYEAVITATGGGVVPQSIVFVALPIDHVPVNDFNGDGMSDIVWRNDAGVVAIWAMNDGMILHGNSLGPVPANWNRRHRRLQRRRHERPAVAQRCRRDRDLGHERRCHSPRHSLGSVPTNWHIAGTGDFNGDGMSDILWRNDAGVVAIWDMNDGMILHGNSLVAPTNWNIAGTGDFNGDGMSDLLWRNDAGVTAIWAMNDGMISTAVRSASSRPTGISPAPATSMATT